MEQINIEDFVNDVWRKDIRALRTRKVNQQAEEREHNGRGKCNVDSVARNEHEQHPQ